MSIIESAQSTVNRRENYIAKYKQLQKANVGCVEVRDRQMAELREVILQCTKGHLSYIDQLELAIHEWLAQSLNSIALSEQKTCQLVLGLQGPGNQT